MDGNIDAGDTSDTKDASDTSGINNNIDNKNTYIKANFSTYNITSINTGIGVDNTIVTDKKVGSNINNTDVAQSDRVSRANKNRMDRADKGKTDRGNIKIGKKVDITAIASI